MGGECTRVAKLIANLISVYEHLTSIKLTASFFLTQTNSGNSYPFLTFLLLSTLDLDTQFYGICVV